MNKKYVLICIMLIFVSFFCFAKKNDQMYVNVQSSDLKSGTSFFSSKVASISYGTPVKIIEEKGTWVKVFVIDDSSISGWIPLGSLTRKKIILDKRGLLSVDASVDELSLAGKGFSAAMEDVYSTNFSKDIYEAIDKMEEISFTQNEILDFVIEGELVGAEK